MAPEIIQSTGGYDGKQTDVWSCGIMLYVRGTGRGEGRLRKGDGGEPEGGGRRGTRGGLIE